MLDSPPSILPLQAFKGFNDLSWHDWSKLTIMLLH
ncbi:hypothetical protein QWA68_004141, partial [Fusarium oxysporum]